MTGALTLAGFILVWLVVTWIWELAKLIKELAGMDPEDEDEGEE